MSNNEVQSRKGVQSQVQPTEKPLEQTPSPRDKSVVKRPLAPAFEKSEVCNKKMRAEEVHDLFAQLKPEGMEPFKEAMAAFCEIVNDFAQMGKKNAELNREVEAAKKEVAAAKVVAESALKKAKEWENRAEMAEKSVEHWKKAFKNLWKNAEDSRKRAEKAEKALNAVRVALINHSTSTIANAAARGTK
nr:uncharacterized protein LOC109153524 [Ipomoea batatas]